MIDFPDKPEDAADFARLREQHFVHPPLPLPLARDDGPQPLVTMQWAWMQQYPTTDEMPTNEGQLLQPHHHVERIEAFGNPLRQLAAALIDAADQADRDGFVPLGINLETRYFMPWSMYFRTNIEPDRRAQCALVAVTARGVRQEWLDRNRATEEKEVLP